MAEQPTLTDLIRVMDAHPMLCDFGYGKSSYPGFDHTASRTDLVENLDQVRTAYTWLKTLHPAGDRHWPTSYGLKHQGEDAGIGYVTNGALIAAAFIAGVPVRVHPDSPNPAIGLSLTPLPEPAPAGSFTAWLAEQRGVDHRIGHLAEDVAADECWPTTGIEYRQFAEHLAKHTASGPAWDTLEEAWEAYSGQPAPSAYDDEDEDEDEDEL